MWPRISHEVAVSVLARTAGLTEAGRSDPGMIYAHSFWLTISPNRAIWLSLVPGGGECYKWLTCFRKKKMRLDMKARKGKGGLSRKSSEMQMTRGMVIVKNKP